MSTGSQTTQNPIRGEKSVPASYPATRKIPATLHDQANKNAGNNSPHRIRTTQPTIQNYYLTTTSITYVFIIYLHTLIYALDITPHDCDLDSF